MSTEWLPLSSISYDALVAHLPEGISICKEHDADHVVLFDGNVYLHVLKTDAGGTLFSQFGVNQDSVEIVKRIASQWQTKMMSYIGEPYDDPELAGVAYQDLWNREFGNKKECPAPSTT